MSVSLRSRVRQAALLGCASGAALLVLAVGQASAAAYPGGGSTFSGSAEGWKVAASPEKSCKLLGLLAACTNDGVYDGTAGAPAGSFAVTTNIPANLITGFQGELTAESPGFTASGGGTGSLALARSFAPGGLFNLTPQFAYTAYLVDRTTNTKQKAITETVEGEVPFATKSGGVSLAAGHSYVIQIETTDSASLLAIGLFGGEAIGYFDNVVVTGPDAPAQPGSRSGADGGHSTGGNGSSQGGAGGGGSAHGVSDVRLERLVKSSSLVGAARLKGGRLSVKARCPRKVGAACTLRLRGLLNRHKAATAGRRARLKQGKVKRFALVVKPAARKAVHKRKRLLFKETVRVGKAKATVYRSLRLIRR